MPPSGIRKFFDVLASMPDVISLGVGEPDFDTPASIVEAGVEALRSGRTHYTSNYGTIELREALSAHLHGATAWSYDPATEMVITVGVSEALAAAMAAVIDPGDEVILAEPSYVAYVPDIIFAGGQPVFVPRRPEDGWQLDPDAVEAAITPRTKALFLGFPNNPTGAVLEPDTIRALAASPNATTCSSSATRSTTGSSTAAIATRPSVRCPACATRTILLGGFSKAYAMTGWRIGYACAPRTCSRACSRSTST